MKLLGAPVKQPVALVFSATPEVAAKSDRRGMVAMADKLILGMKEKGVSAYVPPNGQSAPAPRIELHVKRWDALGGKRMKPWLLGLIGAGIELAHARDVQVECLIFREGDQTASFQHLFIDDTGEAVASDILSRIFTDKTGDTGIDPEEEKPVSNPP